MKLSICIPTYNRPHHLENCLNSILISKRKERQSKLFQIKRRQAPKIAWFQRQRTPRRHARYSDASESFMRLARMAAIFLALAWRSAHQ